MKFFLKHLVGFPTALDDDKDDGRGMFWSSQSVVVNSVAKRVKAAAAVVGQQPADRKSVV